MRRPVATILLAAVVASWAVTGAGAAAVAVAGPASLAVAGPAPVTVELDRGEVATGVGQRLTFTSTVRNTGDQPLRGLIAHLNVLSTDPGTYVDPEDWSSRRTIYLPLLAAGATSEQTWTVQAVNSGLLMLYVTVTAPDGPGDVTASDTLHMRVAAQQTLNAGGVVPLALAVPATLLVLLGLVVHRRRRLR